MTKPIAPIIAPAEIRIVLKRVARNGMQVLEQVPLTASERQQLRDRYDEIDKGPVGDQLPFFKAFFHAAMRHPGDSEPLIVLSRNKSDQMTWQVLDQNENPETGFTVSITPEAGGPPDPLLGFPKNDGGMKIVKSGVPKATHLKHHYKFKVVTADGVTFDPDWYSAP